MTTELDKLIAEQADDMAYGTKAWPERIKGYYVQSIDALKAQGFEIDSEGHMANQGGDRHQWSRNAPLRTGRRFRCTRSDHHRIIDAEGRNRCKECRAEKAKLYKAKKREEESA